MKAKLIKLTKQAFAADGAIVALGGRYTAQQAEYAHAVALGLSGGNQAMLEAETGIGKSLGYLIPSLIMLNLQKKPGRVIVSTFTRVLQKQILNSDLTFAIQVLEQLGIENKAKAAYRMGRAAFFSQLRVLDLVIALKKQYPQYTHEYNEFGRFCVASCESGTGLWMDWLDLNINFPPHISSRDICLLDHQLIDNAAYTLHKDVALDANLLITNHMTLMVYPFKDRFDAVICDEAHEIAGVCNQLFNFKQQISQISNTIREAHGFLPNEAHIKKSIKNIDAWSQELIRLDTKDDFWTDATHPNQMAAQTDNMHMVSLAVKKAQTAMLDLVANSTVTTKQAEILANMNEIRKTLNNWLGGNSNFQKKAIGFSEKLRKPSVASVSLYAGRIFSYRMAQLTDNIILTSATLSDSKREMGFSGTCFALGFDEAKNTVTCKLSPVSYGDMQFVLCPPDMDRPIIVDGAEIFISPRWLKNTAAMILAAADGNEPVLVLTTSFGEVEELRSLLGDDSKFIYHQKGTALSEYTHQLIDGRGTVLITPSAWEGTSLRKRDGTQLLKHVVITRIPFKPKDDLLEVLRNESRTAMQGVNNWWLGQSYAAVIKLKQGLGRGIRSPTDRVTIHICDPRMPMVSGKKTGARNLLAAIPDRFLINYSNAKVFGVEKAELILI